MSLPVHGHDGACPASSIQEGRDANHREPPRTPGRHRPAPAASGWGAARALWLSALLGLSGAHGAASHASHGPAAPRATLPVASPTPPTPGHTPAGTPPDSVPPATITVIPGLKISPEIGIGFGTMAIHSGWPRRGARMEYRVLYTTRHQMELRVSNRTDDFLGSLWEARFEGSFQRFPDNYFGGGNAPVDGDKLEYTPTGGYGFVAFTRPLPVIHPAVQIVAGARAETWSISRVRKVDGTPGAALILGPQVTGHDGGTTDLWELGLEYDSRDSRDVPTRGLHVAQRLGSSLAGRFDYRAAESWIAAHETLGPRWEVAGRLWQKTLFGDPPFFVQPDLGNEDVLRGVPNKRFRDRSAQAAQAELRFNFSLALPVIASWLGKDWQLATFAETGRVGHSLADASRAALHHSGGVGGRLIFNGRTGAMRGDLGFSEHGMALIVKFNQAF